MNYEILIDKRENKKQCSIYPLKEREDFHLCYFDRGTSPLPPLTADVFLHVDGISLDEWKNNRREDTSRPGVSYLGANSLGVSSLAVIDCTWKRVDPTVRRIEGNLPTLVKIPPTFVTSYPRKSKQEGLDPDGGLATIEAIFIAAAFLGTWDESLLDKYHFRQDFLGWNLAQWQRFKLGPYA